MTRHNVTELINYQMLYETEVAPRLREIDIALKALDDISIAEASHLLLITEDETQRLMAERGVAKVDRSSFPVIMQNGSSWLCTLFQREIEIGTPFVYTADEVAYIYGLSTDAVKRAFTEVGVIEATAFTLPIVFTHIPI